MASRVNSFWTLLFAVGLFQCSVTADSGVLDHLDNTDHRNSNKDLAMARTRDTDVDLDLDLPPEVDVPSPSPLIADRLQYRMSGLFAFNGGKPFSLEKDPITGKIDFEKAPLKTVNYTAENTNATDYDEYDEDSYVTDVQSDDIYDKKNIDRKDGNVEGTRPNEINPYSPSLHDFLNLPVHYSSGKYNKEKYPLISSSYANTKVQSGLNSYNTYNHRPYEDLEKTTEPPLYFVTHKTYLPKTTTKPTTTQRISSPLPSAASATTLGTPITTHTTLFTTTTTVQSTQKPTSPTWTTTTYPPRKPSTAFSSLKPPSSTQRIHDDYSNTNYDENFAPFKPIPGTNYGNKPVNSNIPHSQNSHARPIVSDEYDDDYSYGSIEDSDNDEINNGTPTESSMYSAPPSTASTTTLSLSTTTTLEKQESPDLRMKVSNSPSNKGGLFNYTTNLAKKPTTSYSQPVSTGPPPTSLPLGDNHPEKPLQPYPGNPIVHNQKPFETSIDKTINRKPESGNNPVRFYEHPISNNVNPDLSINMNLRPYENGNGQIRPLNVNPNGMKQVESTSSVIIPPGQDTVSFVLGNQQNVDGGHFVGTAIRETAYGSKSEGQFQSMYNSQDIEQSHSQTTSASKKPATNVPVALASVAIHPNPISTEVGQKNPALQNNIEQHNLNFNPQNRPYPPKINGVEPPNPGPLPSFVNSPSLYPNTVLNNPSAVLPGTPNPGRLNIVHPQSGPSETSLNLGVRTSLNVPSLNIGSRPLQNEVVNIRNVPVEASLNLGVRPSSSASSEIDRAHNQNDKHVVFGGSIENPHTNPQNGYVVFPGNSHERPVEEHVIVINEADGSVQEFSPTIKGTPTLDHTQEQSENLPKLSENLTPPDEPIDRQSERPSGLYSSRPFDGRPRPYYPPRPDFLRPPRLPPHSKPGPADGNFKRPSLQDSKLPNILPQFRPNSKSSHGHHGSESIGTIPAVYGPGRQPMLGRRPSLPYLQRLSPPPPPQPSVHALRLVSDSDPGFRDSAQIEGQKYQGALLVDKRYQGHPSLDNQQFRNPVPDNPHFPNSFLKKEKFKEPDSLYKRFRTPLSQSDRYQGLPGTENDQFTEQKLRRNAETESEEISGFEKFSAEPPQIPSRTLTNRRSSTDLKDVPQVTTLQMIQQQGGLDEKVVKPNLPPPFRVKFSKGEDNFDDDDDDSRSTDNDNNEEEKRPVYVVYPMNSVVSHKDDSQTDDESVVVGTRGPHRPLPPDTLASSKDEEEEDGIGLPLLRDKTILHPQNRPHPSSSLKSDFPYPLERPDASLLITQEKPLLVPSDKIDEEVDDENTNVKQHDDTSINLIPYLQDYMPFLMRKTEAPTVRDKPAKFDNLWLQEDSDPRIINKPSDDEAPLYRAPISVTLKTVQPTTVTPIAYAFTPTDDTPDNKKLEPSELIEVMSGELKDDMSGKNPVLPSQQPSSSSSSAPSPQNFMAPFMASVSAEAPSSNGWSVVAKPESNDRSDEQEKEDETQTEQSEFDIENFKPQLFGGFKPIYEFPAAGDSTPKPAIDLESQQD
ncbi:uncharacterized protein LOC107224579 [Neodiprion lecontei]|uniref:Uncharacterized protein LOC107224579 n=1 Tax=Neodiprion lecontei TaxID=441921 RepID=A0A6J0C0V3_NEOLC|nr:uncharacterized protein LOC107224579 [Neodiprion lecontei]XP_046592316.1 uncharacterized protein LOC107224579 [Neodiprion lecontei]